MKARLTNSRILIAILVTITLAAGLIVSVLVFATGDSRLTVTGYSDLVRFEAAGVATLQVQIYDLSGKEVWNSGMVSEGIVDWDRNNDFGERLAYGAYIYSAQGWNAQGDLIFQKKGKLALMPGDKVQLQAAPVVKNPTESSPQRPATEEQPRYAPMAYSHTGDFTISGYLGVGTDVPQRATHLQGRNAVFRMDRDADTSAFLLTRTAPGDFGSIWKTFVVGTNASGVNDGEFIINDIGTAVEGGGARRLTIDNEGRFGINTSSPTATLEVYGSATNLLALYDPVAPTDPKFRVEKTGTVRADGAYYGASYNTGSADVAERINTSEWVEPGNVVEIDPEHPGFFRKSSTPYSTKVAGSISTSPGVILGNSFGEATDDWEDSRPVLAVTGRVPCKVSAENGPIQIGDLLVASSTPGVAMKGYPKEAIGAVVGKAMEPLPEGEGTIVVQVMLR